MSARNSNAEPLTDFIFQAAVPKVDIISFNTIQFMRGRASRKKKFIMVNFVNVSFMSLFAKLN